MKIKNYSELRAFEKSLGAVETGSPRDVETGSLIIGDSLIDQIVHPNANDDIESGGPDFGGPDFGGPEDEDIGGPEDTVYVDETGAVHHADDLGLSEETGYPDQVYWSENESGAPKKVKATKVKGSARARKRSKSSQQRSFSAPAKRMLAGDNTKQPKGDGMPFASVYNADLQSSPVGSDQVITAAQLHHLLMLCYGSGPVAPLNATAAESGGSATATVTPPAAAAGVKVLCPLVVVDLAASVLYQVPSTVITINITYINMGLASVAMNGFKIQPKDAAKAARLVVIPFATVQSRACPQLAVLAQDIVPSVGGTVFDASLVAAGSGMPTNSLISCTAVTTEHNFFSKLLESSYSAAFAV
jgi:hypothetical protein